jgi:hypothetical protein
VFAVDCKWFREQIVLESYGELAVDPAAKLEAHMKACAECREFQARLIETQRALNQWDEVERPINLDALHEKIRAKSRRWRFQRPIVQRLAWGMAAGVFALALSVAALAWVGVDARWKDNGLTLRFGPAEQPEITRADLASLLEAQRQEMNAETVRQIRAALTVFGEQLQEHLGERQSQTEAQIELIYQALQSQRAEDLRFVRREIQKLAGATEDELLQANRAIEFLLASHVEGMQRYR